MNILIAILVLGVIIFIHELGHFAAAKFFKMPVSEFAIGMGPQVYSYDTMKTTYSLRAIPIGGFVNIEGMDIDSEVEDGFNTKPAYARFIVLIAGVFMNFLLAFIVLFITVYSNGMYKPETKPIIGEVFPDTAASKYIKAGDKILDIDGNAITQWKDIGATITKVTKDNKEIDNIVVTLEREGQAQTLDVPLTKDPNEDRKILGVVPKFIKEPISIGEAAKLSVKSGVKIFTDTLNGLKMIGTGKVKTKELTGPIGIIKVVGDASNQGVSVVLWLMALISVNIGVLNLLPFPALDGGRLIFVILEMVGVKINKKVEERVHIAGMIFLFGLIIFITTNDIFNLVK